MSLLSDVYDESMYPTGSMPCPICRPVKDLVTRQIGEKKLIGKKGCPVCHGLGYTNKIDWAPRSEDELVPGLWISGWDAPGGPFKNKTEVDLLIDMAGAGPKPDSGEWIVNFVHDDKVTEEDLLVFHSATTTAYEVWQAGGKVILRCQTGLNRSGFVAAMTIMASGKQAEKTVKDMRKKRSPYVLHNPTYLAYLLEL
jgi:hypothetical protein